MGSPRANRIAVVEAASRTLSQIACQSISLSRYEETVLFQDAPPAVGKQERAEIAKCPRILQDNAALLHAGIGIQRNLPVAPTGTQGRGQRQGQRDDAGVGRATFHKLKRLRDVL